MGSVSNTTTRGVAMAIERRRKCLMTMLLLAAACWSETVAAQSVSAPAAATTSKSVAVDYVVISSGPGGGPLAANLAKAGYRRTGHQEHHARPRLVQPIPSALPPCHRIRTTRCVAPSRSAEAQAVGSVTCPMSKTSPVFGSMNMK
jgi:hypothetical protein